MGLLRRQYIWCAGLSISNRPTGSNLLDPLSAPSWRIKWLGEVLRFVNNFAVLKLHYADGIERTALVGNRVFRNPQFTGTEKPPNAEAGRFARVMTAKVLQIPFAVYPFTGLRVIADGMLVVDLMLNILISGRGSLPMLMQSDFDLLGCRALAILIFD